MKIDIIKLNPRIESSYQDLKTGDFFILVENFKASGDVVCKRDISMKLRTGYVKMFECNECPDIEPVNKHGFNRVYKVSAELTVTHNL